MICILCLPMTYLRSVWSWQFQRKNFLQKSECLENVSGIIEASGQIISIIALSYQSRYREGHELKVAALQSCFSLRINFWWSEKRTIIIEYRWRFYTEFACFITFIFFHTIVPVLVKSKDEVTPFHLCFLPSYKLNSMDLCLICS